MTILLVIVLLQSFLMLWLFICGNKASYEQERIDKLESKEADDIDVIITAHEEYSVIRQAVLSLEPLRVHSIILALDHPDNDLMNQILQLSLSKPIIVEKNFGEPGKIHTQKLGLLRSCTEYVLIMDADIKVSLLAEEFNHMFNCFIESNCDFFCPYSFGIYSDSNTWAKISDCDRTMRQQIVRAGRDYYRMSNLSGYFLLAKREKYLQVIDANYLQDDVVATINLFKQNMQVRTYHHVVCGELERESFYKSLMQRVRWTAGNLLIYPKYIDIFHGIGIKRGVVFVLSSHLWYTSLYCDLLAYVLCFMYYPLIYALMFEIVIKTLILSQRKKGTSNFFYHMVYSLVWPLFATISLFGVIPYLIFKLENESRR